MVSELLLDVQALRRSFRASRRAAEVLALDGLDLSIEAGEFVVLRGPSGCGKTTLLLTLGGLRRPTSGSVHFEGEDLFLLPSARRCALRRGPIGFMFQEMHLLPYLDAQANVALAAAGSTSQRSSRAAEILSELGLAGRLKHRPAQLSAGERQRVAVARALAQDPSVILADEPTGSLDPENAEAVMEQLQRYQQSGGTVVLVTHASELCCEQGARELRMSAGRLGFVQKGSMGGS